MTEAPGQPVRTGLSESEKAEVLPCLQDPVWRLCNLYRITDKKGRDIPFVPTAEQLAIILSVYRDGVRRHVILKARQMGFSTLIELMIFDACYFGENITASIVDLTQQHASAKLAKISFAHERLGPLQERLTENNKKAIGFRNGSHIYGGKSARGGTNQILHISEWGPIAHDDPKRSEEIKTGALPSAEEGLVFNESTFKGGKGGHFYEGLKAAMETPDHLRTAKDAKFWFFPWYLDKSYSLEGDPRGVPPEVNAYLDEKEKQLGITFTQGQRLWYAKTKAEQGIFMWREYPTTVEEALSAPVEGSIYGDLITRLRSVKRIVPFERSHAAPVWAFWDIGWDDSTTVWLVQVVGPEFFWIWHTCQRGHTAAMMYTILHDSDIPIAGHFIPHDAFHKSPGQGKNYRDYMVEAGFAGSSIRAIPKCASIWDGINGLRDILPRSYFNLTHCQQGLDALEAYHTKDTSSGGVVSKEPVHDWSSHSADAARYVAEALAAGIVATAAAKRALEVPPRLPDGSAVDHQPRHRRTGLARTGLTLP